MCWILISSATVKFAMSMVPFDQRKSAALAALGIVSHVTGHDADDSANTSTIDRSPKGSLDEPIADLGWRSSLLLHVRSAGNQQPK